MPTVLDYVREKDPRFKTVSDTQLRAYIQDRHPDLAASLPPLREVDPQNPMIGVPSASVPIAGFGGGMATLQTAKDVQAAAVKGESALRTGASMAAGTAALAGLAPLAGAAGAVGTVSGLTGVGAMTGIGGISSVVKQATDYVLGGEKKSIKDLGKEVAIDALITGASQGALNVGDEVLALGGRKVVMPLVARSAAMFDRGQRALNDYGVKLLNGIRMVVDAEPVTQAGKTAIHLGDTLTKFKDMVTAQRSGMSATFKERWPDLMAELMAANGDVAKLVEAKGTVSQFAWKNKGVSFEEKNALTWLDEQLKERIGGAMKFIGGKDGKALYDAYLSNRSQLSEYSAGLHLTEEAIKRVAARATLGLAGGGAGFLAGERTKPGIVSGTTGAVAGVAAATIGAPFILERMILNRTSGPVVKLAINEALRGNLKEANTQFGKAVAISGVQKLFGPLLKEPAQDFTDVTSGSSVGGP
jgi:hypothetical protein